MGNNDGTLRIDVEPANDVAQTAPRGIPIIFQDVEYLLPAKRGESKRVAILKGISGFFLPSTMTAVMGPSGSGKTTLMDVLSGRKTVGEVRGELRFGRHKPTPALLRRQCGYCEQQDTLVDVLSVEEMLMYTALLKRPRSEGVGDKQQAVDQLLTKLALQGCRSTRIGSVLKRGISGGQAKRVNVGIALITSPPILFLDEPTSGLDSWTANEVMEVVKGLARDGTTICATIHSPSSFCFALFERVMVLVAGRVVYSGHNNQESVDYFTSQLGVRALHMGENLAEWIMDLCTQADQDGRAAEIADKYTASDLAKANQQTLQGLLTTAETSFETPTPPQTGGLSTGGEDPEWAGSGCSGWWARQSYTYVTPAWYSLYVLLKYRTLRNYQTMDYLGPRMFDKLIFAVVIMALYWNMGRDFASDNVPNMSALMYLCVAQPAWGAVTFVPTIVIERALYVRERHDGLYRPITYLIFKMIDELTLNWLVGLGTAGIIYGGVRLAGSYIYFWLMLLTTLSNGMVIAYGISALCPSLDVANASVPTLLAIMLFLSGFLIRIPDIPVYLRWLTYVNLLKYSWGGLMINQFEAEPGAAIGGHPILEYYELNGVDKWGQLGICAAFFLAWCIIGWLAVAFVRHHQR